MHDLNRANLANSTINIAINAVLDSSALAQEQEARREYLGASGIGSECLRRVQYDWQCDSVYPARTRRIFARGHAFENIAARLLSQAGFRMERDTPATVFESADGLFRGHADGIILDGPEIIGLNYPCLWEHKGLGASGWRKLEKDGLRKAYSQYFDQVQIYLAYLNLDTNAALFTAWNSDSCELLHLLIPFDAEAAQAASDRAVRVIQATQAGELLDRVASKPDDWRCKVCSHRERCWRSGMG